MNINTVKTINSYKCTGKINRRYDMTIEDIKNIQDVSEGIFDLINNAFVFGYAQGTKAARKEMTV